MVLVATAEDISQIMFCVTYYTYCIRIIRILAQKSQEQQNKLLHGAHLQILLFGIHSICKYKLEQSKM